MFETKKLLIVVESIEVDGSSGAKANVALIKNIAGLSCEIKVLHYTRKVVETDLVNCIPIKERKFNVFYLLSRVRRLINRYFKKDLFYWVDSVLGFSFIYYNDSKSIANSIKKHYQGEDLILTLSHGGNFKSHHAMLHFPEHYGKWVAYIHDPYPFHCYPRPYDWVERGYRVKERLMADIAKHAKVSLFPSLLLKEWMGSYFSEFLKTGEVIPHQHLEGGSTISENVEHLLDFEKFNLLHAGNLLKQRDPKGLVEGFLLFIDQYPEAREEARLTFVGSNNDFKAFMENATQLSNGIISYKGKVSYDVANILQQKASVNIILEAKSEISPFLPGKFPHCVFADKPIISLSPQKSEVRRLLGEDYPYCAEIDDRELIAKIIFQLYVKWKKGNLSLGRPDLKNYLGIEYLREKITEVYAKLDT